MQHGNLTSTAVWALRLALASALLLGGVGVTVCEPWLARIRPALMGPIAAWRR